MEWLPRPRCTDTLHWRIKHRYEPPVYGVSDGSIVVHSSRRDTSIHNQSEPGRHDDYGWAFENACVGYVPTSHHTTHPRSDHGQSYFGIRDRPYSIPIWIIVIARRAGHLQKHTWFSYAVQPRAWCVAIGCHDKSRNSKSSRASHTSRTRWTRVHYHWSDTNQHEL